MKINRLLMTAIFSFVGVLAVAQSWMMQPQGPVNEFSAMEGTSVLNYNFQVERNIHSRAGNGPVFYIFPDCKLDNNQALELAGNLDLVNIIKEYGGRIMVVNPSSDKWQEQDLEDFRRLIGMGSSPTNVKVIGIGSGATFVNRQLVATELAGVIAGIVSIDGEPGKICRLPVPAFIGGKNAAKAAKPYQTTSDSAPADPLQKVVVNTDKKASLETLFAEAWDKVLSANYRYNNLYRTFYMSRGIDNPEGVKNFELVSIPVFDKLGIQRNVVEYPLVDMNAPSRPENPDKYLWYEYIPKQMQEAAPSTVPLVVLLHGHGNDPRTQSESSGFIELAAEEGFMVVEMEWQGSKGYQPMGLDGIEAVISVILQKYPQIDTSRIYAEGLSAGAMTSNMLGVRKSHLFAAVAGHSGGIFSGNGIGYYAYGSEPLMNEAIQKRGNVEVGFCSVVGTHDDTIRFFNKDNWEGNPYLNVWRIYETINGMPVTGNLDFSVDSTFGFALQDRTTIHTGKSEDITIEFGQLYKDEKPMIRLMVINNYGHWNFKPAARLIWDFFRHFSRDTETKELRYLQ
jgi:predicted esterase